MSSETFETRRTALADVVAIPVTPFAEDGTVDQDTHRALLRRLGLTGPLTSRREVIGFAALAGLVAPLLGALPAVAAMLAAGRTPGDAGRTALELAGVWALALLSMGTALLAGSERRRHAGRGVAWWIAFAAVAAELGQAYTPTGGALLLAPHVLLLLHALQAAPRDNARVGFALLMLFVVLITFGEVGDLLRR